MKSFSFLALILCAGISQANLIVNGSFEADQPDSTWVGDVYTTTVPTGWTWIAGTAALWRPTNYSGAAYIPGNQAADGLNAGYTGSDDVAAEMWQITSGYTIGAADTVSFSYKIGHRISNAGSNQAVVKLEAVDTFGNKTLLSSVTDTAGDGAWQSYSFNFGPSDLAGVVGQRLLVDLSNGPGTQGTYDDFHLTATPEPATLAALALGAGTLLRRRRNS